MKGKLITSQEIELIVEKIRQEGVPITLISYGILACIAFIASYLGGYLRRKGENVATKEDVKKITDQIESVKYEYAKDLHINQTRYGKEFEILLELNKKIFPLRDAICALQPKIDVQWSTETKEEQKHRKLQRYEKAAKELYEIIESYRPFYPKEIYHLLKNLDDLGWREAVRYDYFDLKKDGQKAWDEAAQNQEKIHTVCENIIEAIRQRVIYWEEMGKIENSSK